MCSLVIFKKINKLGQSKTIKQTRILLSNYCSVVFNIDKINLSGSYINIIILLLLENLFMVPKMSSLENLFMVRKMIHGRVFL